MKTVSLPEWKLVPHSGFRKLSKDLSTVFSECHVTAQVIWDRNGPCVVFEKETDAAEFVDHYHDDN